VETIICDECIRADVALSLMRAGYQVLYVPYLEPGMKDSTIKHLGRDLDAYIVTADRKDFLDYEKSIVARGDWGSKRICRLVEERIARYTARSRS
jgi:hypothetical protein